MPADRKKTVSIIDVAKYAGVSQQTVSRVANGSDLVRESTRRKVREAMKSLGYSPNRQARALRNGQSKMIGLVINYYRNNAIADLLEGMASSAAKLGFGIMMIPTGTNAAKSLAAEADYILSLNLDGLIVFSDDDIPENSVEQLHGIPTVVIGSLGIFPAGWGFVDTAEKCISELAVEHLLGLGHRTVCHISGPLSFPAAVIRVASWKKTLAAHGAPVSEPFEAGDWLPDDGYRAALRLLDRYPDCTAVYAADDAIASGVMEACHERGLAVGRDISVMGVDDILGDFVPNNILTTIRRDYVDAGSRAFAMLMRMQHTSEPAEHEVVLPRLVARASTARYR